MRSARSSISPNRALLELVSTCARAHDSAGPLSSQELGDDTQNLGIRRDEDLNMKRRANLLKGNPNDGALAPARSPLIRRTTTARPDAAPAPSTSPGVCTCSFARFACSSYQEDRRAARPSPARAGTVHGCAASRRCAGPPPPHPFPRTRGTRTLPTCSVPFFPPLDGAPLLERATAGRVMADGPSVQRPSALLTFACAAPSVVQSIYAEAAS